MTSYHPQTQTRLRHRLAPLAVAAALLALSANSLCAAAPGDGAEGDDYTPQPAATPPLRSAVSTNSALVYDRDYPFVHYGDAAVHNDIARMEKRISNGSLKLIPTLQHGYLESVLAALNIDPDSQVLEFSKTSLQVDAISVATPRAIYFNDDTYVAWVQTTGMLEIVTMDGDRGAVFYAMYASDLRGKPQRETLRCLTCHDTYSEMGGGVPRFLFESVYDIQGDKLIPDTVARETSNETPIADRWGGYYVTGKDGGAMHLGNILPPASNAPINVDKVRRGSLQSLDPLFDTSPYLRPTSDIVALLVLQHQVSVHDEIIHASYKSRVLLNKERPDTDSATLHWAQLSPKVQARLDEILSPLVNSLLMVKAAPLLTKVTGGNGFTASFESRGPKDPQGRSLRQLDLNTRLFRYPLSFLIYSEGVDSLPLCVREHLYTRLAWILQQRDPGSPYNKLSAANRRAAYEILLATKPEFARDVSTLSH